MNNQEKHFTPLSISLEGIHSIAASAGTGKTFSITTLYLRYLLETDCRVDDILVTTFTEAATAELKERVRARLSLALDLVREVENQEKAEKLAKDGLADEVLVQLLAQAGAWDSYRANDVRERMENAILNFSHAPIFTIHGFCNRILQEQVFETSSRFRAELVTSVDDLIDEAVCDFASRHWTETDSALANWIDLNESLWKSMRELVKKAIDNPSAEVVPADNLDSLLESTLMDDFSDLSQTLVEAWKKGREEIQDLLFKARDNGWLNGNTHGREGQLERSIAFVDAFVKSPTIATFGNVDRDKERLGQSSLLKGTKKAHKEQHPRHDAFEELEVLLKRVAQINDHRELILISVRSKLVTETRNQIAKRQRDLGVMTFSDLLNQVDLALAGPQGHLLLEELRQQYRVALVDEFQDTDPVQYRIFQRIFQEAAQQPGNELRAFVMIGDVKQSIFRFRGADVHSYLCATDATPIENRHVMDINWRSDKSLVDSVQAVLGSCDDPFLNEKIPLPDVSAKYGDRIYPGASLQIVFVPRHEHLNSHGGQNAKQALEQVLRQTIGDIVDQLQNPPMITDNDGQQRPIAAGDLAVLCRTGKQLRLFQAELASRGVPAVLQTDESIFDTLEAKSMAILLSAIVTPPKQHAMLNALATPVFSLNASELLDIRNDDLELSSRFEDFRTWHELWHKHGFIVMWRRLIDQQDMIAKLAGKILGERQVANFIHLGESLHRHAVKEHAGPAKLLRWLESGIANPMGRKEDENQLRLETDAEAVQLCTIHKSKGLEYPIVYCPTLWHSIQFPPQDYVIARTDADGQRLQDSELDVGSSDFDRRQKEYEFEDECEDRRLLYVALTRARHQCRIYWTASGSAHKSALGKIMLPGLSSKDDDAKIEASLRSWVDCLESTGIEFTGSDSGRLFQDTGNFLGQPKPKVTLACRDLRRKSIPPLEPISFSSLSRSIGPFSHMDIQDRDEAGYNALSRTESSEGTGRVPLADVRGGRKLGNLVHDVFEDLLSAGKLQGADRNTVRSAVEQRMLARIPLNNLDLALQGPLTDSMTDWLRGTLHADGVTFCLADLATENLTCEMPFILSVADSQRDAELKKIESALKLSSRSVVRDHSPRWGDLRQRRGFLRGFIDLAFCVEGRWYVLDYKTNDLGSTFSDYSNSHLESAMAHHDYILQYHLYAVALHLFLKQRIPDYNYDRHFGGAIYFFVRGFQADTAPTTGIYYDRPSREVIKALANSLEGVATCQS